MMHNPPHPSEVLREMHMQNMTITELAKRMGRSRNCTSKLVNGKCDITPRTALILEKVVGGSAEMWLNMQHTYNLWRLRNE